MAELCLMISVTPTHCLPLSANKSQYLMTLIIFKILSGFILITGGIPLWFIIHVSLYYVRIGGEEKTGLSPFSSCRLAAVEKFMRMNEYWKC